MNTFRHRIDHGFEAMGGWIAKHPLLTILFVAAAVGLALFRLPELGFDTSNESYFRKDDPTLSDYDRFRGQFGREEYMLIAITPPEVFDRPFLEKLSEFHDTLESELPYLKDITSLVNVRDTRGEGDTLVVEDLMEEIPSTPAEMEAFRERVLGSELYRNFLISEDGKVTTIVVETLAYSPEEASDDLLAGFDDETPAPSDARPEEQGRIPLTVEENREFVYAAKAIADRFSSDDFPIQIAGSPSINDYFEQTMQRDMGTFLGLAVITICIFLLVLFRRVTGVVLPIVVVLLSLMCTIGVMAWSGVPFTIPTTILPSFILATGVGASVHFLAIFYLRYAEHGHKGGAIQYALGHSGLPIVFTSITTAAGLFSFATAEMAPVAHMGIFGGIGTLISLVLTLILAPALLALFPISQHPRIGSKGPSPTFDRVLIWVADFSTRRATAVVSFSVALMVTAAIGLTFLHFSMDFLKWFPEKEPLRVTTEMIDRELHGSINLEVVVNTNEENGLYEPRVINALDDLSKYAAGYIGPQGRPMVGKTNSVLDVLRETNRALNENRQEAYTLPQDRQLIAQEFLLFENSGSDDLEQLVDSQFSTARLTLIVPNRDAATYVNFVDDVKARAQADFGEGTDITVTGTLNLFSNMINNMMWSMAKSYLYAGIAITIMMMMLIGSLRLGLLSMVPNFAPILITLGIVMGFSGINLDAFNLTLGAIALGLAVDDTIHFFHNFRRYYGEMGNTQEAVRRTLLTTGRALLFTSLVLITGFLIFIFATLNNVMYFGVLTAIALFFALLGDFFLAPALMELVTRTKFGREVATRWAGTR